MISELESILCKDVIIRQCEPYSQIQLKETASDSKIITLDIKRLPKESIAFTLDYKDPRFQQLSPYLNKSAPGINTSCDLVIVWEEDDQTNALLLDLKSNSNKPEKFKMQLDNSEVFLKYIFNVIELHFKEIVVKPVNIIKTIANTQSSKYMRNETCFFRKKSSESPYNIVSLAADDNQRHATVYFKQLI